MGEKDFEEKGVVKAVDSALQKMGQAAQELCLSTPGGRFHVRWDENGSATAMGQLAFFAEFLEVTGLFSRWADGCSLTYTSPNVPKVVDILGTWLLSILDGQRRYAHIAGLRGDEVAPEIPGMGKIVSDESLRRALSALAPGLPKRCVGAQRAACLAQVMKSAIWMDTALSESTREALSTAWILDADTSVKLLYGRQIGAEIGYNPRKPGQPSHTLHTYWISNVRLVLDVEVQNGKSHAPKHSLPRLRQLIEGLAPEKRPTLVRGDNAFGNEGVMAEMEEIDQRYLFKLRQTDGIRRLIERKWQQNQWQNVGQGFYTVEDELRLAGWSRARRVVVLRRQVKGNLAAEVNSDAQQRTLHFVDHSDKIKLWEHTVLVTNADYSLEAFGRLYRDRADCENGFDELKNQWGWDGYTTHDLERCNLSVRAVALIYNWWSGYVRLAHPRTHLEAITSRPMLPSGVARLTRHAGQSRLLLTLAHEAGNQIKAMISNIRNGLDSILANAPQLSKMERWPTLVHYIVNKIIAARSENPPVLNSPTFHLASSSG
ncbi:transposase [Nitrosomonas sp. Nm33]|uniref:transposase n=1 Tax=Nitrosomonas sp. Nm33 TaxID=133724 RepID=UPI00089C58AF|nr:transposase [Nitrosomonas sp. Nm33]SDZ09621.1 Transposase DDE domain group 1 [Nitrosomonas sp. Nm33]